MEYEYELNGVKYVTSDWLSYSDYSNGGAVARANVRTVLESAKKIEHLSYRFLSDFEYVREYSTYSHDDATIAAFAARPDVIHLTGGYDTNELLLRSDWCETDDIMSALANYPVLDDQVLGDVEREMEDEAWSSWIQVDFQDAVLKQCPDSLSDDFDDWLRDLSDSDLFAAMVESGDKIGEYGHVDGDAWWINVDRIAPVAFRKLFADYYTP